jgi:hypothetical protein
MCIFRAAASALILALGLVAPAQGQDRQTNDFYATWRNAVGILRYCEAQGHLTADLAEDGIASLGFFLLNEPAIPTPAERALALAWEKEGERGRITSSARTVAQEAALAKISEAIFCRNLRTKVLQLQPTQQRHDPGERIGLQLGAVNYCRDKGHITPVTAERIVSLLRAEFAALIPVLSSPEMASLSLTARSVTDGKSWWDWRDKKADQRREGAQPPELCKELSQQLGADNAALLEQR